MDAARRTRMGSGALLLMATVIFGGCMDARAESAPGGETQELTPDVILHGGVILTVDEDFTVAEAMATYDGRVARTGSDGEIMALAGTDTRMIDLQGRAVLPGFYDNHIHLGGEVQEWYPGTLIAGVPQWIRNATTLEELGVRLSRRAAETPEGEWITGALTREEWPNQRVPTRWELDEMVSDHPVALTRGPHTLVLNSLALEIVGIDRNTPDPPGGWIFRNAEGEPNGRVLEAAKRMVDPYLPEQEQDEAPLVERYRSLLSQLTSLGITSVNLAGVRPGGLATLQEVYEKYGEELPRMTAQVRLSPGFDTYDDPEEGARKEIAALDAIDVRTGFGNDRLKLGAVKMSIDGGLSAPVLWTLDPYHNRPDFHGVQRIPDETFYEVARHAHDRGWQLGIHTIGDAAAVMVVRELARILEESPRPDHRHFLHHVTVKPPEETLQLMADNDLIVATHPSWTTGLGAYAEEALGPGPRLETQNPSRSLLDRGIRLSYGSDSLPYGPLFNIWNAVTRKGWDGKVYGPQEAVTVEEAIRLHTMGSAYMTFDEDERSSLERGKVADFVILSEDPREVEEDRIRDIRVAATWIGGKEVYRAP